MKWSSDHTHIYKMADEVKPKNSRLFSYGLLDVKDDIDERLEDCQKSVLSCVVGGQREAEVYEQLNMKVCRSQQDHDETVLALLYLILTDSNEAQKWYSTLTMVTRDSMAVVLQITELLILEKLPKLLEATRVQLLWLAKEMIHTGVGGADRLCFAFLKQMPGGSTDADDIWLVERVLHLFLDHRAWLESHTHLVASVVYTYLSLLPTHISCSNLSQLKDTEIKFVVSLLRNKFHDCIQIGRDLLRLLQAVSRVSEFSGVWFDILNNPDKLSPGFTGVQQLLTKRTSRRFIAGRIVTDAEIKLNFLLSKVKFGQHKRYQEWFTNKYLSSVDSLHMIPELVRFVCCVIHPSNEVLGSDVMPRWALVGWLLSLCQTNQVVFMNAKLSLFYDWLGYSPDSDYIMNIEPAALLMYNSLRTHPQITISLLDFICRLIPNYLPGMEEEVRDGFQTAFHDIASKGVLPSIESVLFSVKLDKELRASIKSMLPDFSPSKSVTIATDEQPSLETESVSDVIVIEDDIVSIEERDEVTLSVVIEDESPDTWDDIDKLPEPLKEKLDALKMDSASVDLLNDLLIHIKKCDYSHDVLSMVCSPLMECVSEDLSISCDESTLDTRQYYHMLQLGSVELLKCSRAVSHKMGYYTLYYCHKIESYELYEKSIATDATSLAESLSADLKVCAEEDNAVFAALLPDICNKYSNELTGNVTLLNTVVSHVDPSQLNELIILLSLRKMLLFGRQPQDLIICSLQWESFEQFCLWQLLAAEGCEPHHIVPLLKQMVPSEHPEAISGMILLLRIEPTIPAAVGNLLSLPMDSHGDIVKCVFTRWVSSKPSKMAKFVDYCFTKVQKLNDPLPTLSVMMDNLNNAIDHTDDILRAEYVLSGSLRLVFDTHASLVTRCHNLHSRVSKCSKDDIVNKAVSIKRRQSSDSDDIVRTKRKRITTIEELSD